MDGLLVMVQARPLEMVEVGRQPEVFVRPLEPDEAQRVVKVARTTRDRVRLRHFPWLDDPPWFPRTLATFLG